jgi:hypothetical protein
MDFAMARTDRALSLKASISPVPQVARAACPSLTQSSFRLNGESDDLVVDPNVDNTEQHMRSRIARFIKNNGTAGTTGSINHWALDGVKLYRYSDVMDFLASKGLAGHEWYGGNVS